MTTEPSHPGPATAPQAERGVPPSSLPVLTEHPSARRGGCVTAIIRRSPREPGRHGGTPSPARDVTGPAEARTRCRCRRLLAPAGWERARRGSRVPPAASAPPAPAEQPRSEGPARGWRLPASSRSATGRTRPSPGARACHCSVEPDTSSEAEKGWAGALVPGCPCHQSVCDPGDSPELLGKVRVGPWFGPCACTASIYRVLCRAWGYRTPEVIRLLQEPL